MTDEELHAWALSLHRQHDPANQDFGYPQRCGLCGFVRYPCDTYELAGAVLSLLYRMQH